MTQEVKSNTLRRKHYRELVSMLVGVGATLVLCAYFVMHHFFGLNYCHDFAANLRSVMIVTIGFIAAFALSFICRRSILCRAIFMSLAVLIGLFSIFSIWCFFAYYLGQSSEVITTNGGNEIKSIQEQNEVNNEVSQEKLRDVVTKNIATLAELDALKKAQAGQIAQGAATGSATQEQVVIQNYSITESTDFVGLECDDDQIMHYSGEWKCASFEDLLEDVNGDSDAAVTNTLSGALSGNVIATYTDTEGNAVNIAETVTSLVENVDGTFTYTSEDGGSTVISIANLETITSITDNADGTFAYTNENGSTTIVNYQDFTVDQTTVTYNGGRIECAIDGNILQWNGLSAQWVCVPNVGTVYASGSGVDLVGTTFSVDAPTCTGTDKLTWSGTAFVCNIDIDTDTQLTEAEVDAFANNNGYLTSFTEVDGSITNEINTAFAINGSNLLQITDSSGTLSVSLAPYLDNTDVLAGLGCSSDQIAKWNGSAWACAVDIDTDTTYTNVSELTNDAGYLTSFTEVDGSVTNEVNTAFNLTVGNVLQITDSNGTLSVPLTGLLDNTDVLEDLSCADDQIAKYNAGTTAWECAADIDTDTDTTYAAGDGVTLTGTTFAVNAPTCTGTDKLTWSGTVFSCVADIDTNTTYTNLSEFVDDVGYLTTEVDGVIGNEYNTTLTLSGNTLQLTDGGDTLTQDLGSIDTNTLYTNGSGLSLVGTTFSIDAPTCTGTDKLTWNGTVFTCAADIDTDTDTTYTAGAGVTLTGTVFSVDSTNAVVDFTNLTNVPAGLADGDDDTTYIAGTGLTLTGTTFAALDTSPTNEHNTGITLTGNNLNIIDGGGTQTVSLVSLADTLSGLTCTDTQVPKWNATTTAWECAADIDTDTQLTEAEVDAFANNNGYLTSFTEVDGVVGNEYNTALTLTGDTLRITDGGGDLDVDLSGYTDNYTNGSGLSLTGATFAINAPTCAATEKLSWNGTAFQCLTDIDTDTDTTYLAGTGLTLSGTTFNLSGTPGTVTSVATGNGLTGGPITTTGTVAINAPTCTATEKLTWNGTAFQCAADIDTDTTIADDQTLTFTSASNELAISDGNTVDLSDLDHEQTYTEAAGVPAITGAEVGDWYEDTNSTLKYVWDGTQWKLLESGNGCFLGGAAVDSTGTLNGSNGIISSVTRNSVGKYTVNLSQTLVVDDYVIQATAHDTDVGQINLSNAIIDIIAKGTDSFDLHVNFGDNGNVEDEEGDSDFEVALFDLNCDPTTGVSSADDEVGNEILDATVSGGLERAGSGTTAAPYTLGVDTVTAGTTTTDRNNSGLEVAADGLSLLRGCDDAEILAWDATAEEWECQDNTPVDIGSAYDVYDNAGGQAYTAGVITVNLDTVRHAHTNYGLAADVVMVNSDGLYEITFDGSADNPTNGTRSTAAWWIETDTSGAFTEVDGSRCFTYHRTAADGEQSCSRTIILNLNATDQLRIRTDALDNNTGLRTLADGTSLTIKKFVESGADYAEVYYTSDDTLSAGHIITLDTDVSASVKKADSGDAAMGVVSTNPGQTIGAGDDWESGRPIPVALVGRIPVRVSAENGEISPGDYITLSSNDGVGMRATEPGYVIGIALDAPSGEQNDQDDQTVMTFISTQWFFGEGRIRDASIQKSNAEVIIEQDGFADFVGGVWEVTEDFFVSAKVTFEETVIFLGQVTFMGRVNFADSDVAGNAIVTKGEKSVKVIFDDPYDFIPYVNATANNAFAPFRVGDISEKEFTIHIEKEAQQDIVFTWNAVQKTSDAEAIKIDLTLIDGEEINENQSVQEGEKAPDAIDQDLENGETEVEVVGAEEEAFELEVSDIEKGNETQKPQRIIDAGDVAKKENEVNKDLTEDVELK